MAEKIKYEYGESVILNGVEWDWEDLKQCCHSDFVHEAKARGSIIHKYKVPREILNEWIIDENWEYDKKSFWQRPISYRIDGALNELINNVAKLTEIQQEVNDISFEKENLLSRVKLDIEIQGKDEIKKYKTFILEKYSVAVGGFEDDDIPTELNTEIRYKTELTDGEILIKYLKEKGKQKRKKKTK